MFDEDDDDNAFWSEDDAYFNEGEVSNGENVPPVDIGESRKVTVIAIGIGVVLMVFALALSTIVTTRKQSVSVSEKGNTQTVETQVPSYHEAVGGSSSQVNKAEGNWVSFSIKDYGQESDYIDSVFTVESVMGYVNKGTGGLGELRYVANGRIEGLPGVYELTIDYAAAKKLYEGTNFKVWYKLIEVGNSQLVSSIVTNK